MKSLSSSYSSSDTPSHPPSTMPTFMMPLIKSPSFLHENLLPFKQRKSFATRREETDGIRSKFPTKIPVIVERYRREKELPLLDKTKFLVPQELSMSQFITIIRSRMSVSQTQAFFFIVNRRSMATLSLTLAEIYDQEKDHDGFLYMTYCSQEGFGGDEGTSASTRTVVPSSLTNLSNASSRRIGNASQKEAALQ